MKRSEGKQTPEELAGQQAQTRREDFMERPACGTELDWLGYGKTSIRKRAVQPVHSLLPDAADVPEPVF